MQKICTHCSVSFDIDAIDEDFFARIGMPIPIDCPPCRRQRRLMFRNFFHLYHRTCDLSGKKIISMYDTDASFPVYEMHEWWSDKWDPLNDGIEPSFDSSFFDQLGKLHRTVPRMSIMNAASENTDYCNMCANSNNCYLVHGCVHNEDCMYGHIVWRSKDCCDCLYIYQCEWCCECIDCVQCHTLLFSRDCDNCSFSSFLVHCAGCQHCFGCVGLKQKSYHIFNQPYSREDYDAKIASFRMDTAAGVQWAKSRLEALVGKEIVKVYHGFNSEHVTGDYLYGCKNIADGYDLKNCEDCRHCATLEDNKDCQDCNFSANPSELSFNTLTSYGHRVLCSHSCMSPSSDITYCDNCFSCKNCFGCVGLKKKEYCILNKQYSKETYEDLRAQLVAFMQQTGEWGQFFPYTLSPFAYNETIASQYFPLSREEVIVRGWRWKEMESPQEQYLGPSVSLPDSIGTVSDDVLNQILLCEVTGKPYKVIPQELKFYRSMGIPIPKKCFDQRHKERMALRNPRKLWTRVCAKCQKSIETTYSPDRPEIVYCEECYLKEVY